LLNHVSRMEDIRYPEQLLDYQPIGRRPGWPLKRLLDRHIMKLKQIIYWPNPVTRRRKRISGFCKN
jgi:hypothetical protein